MTTPASPLLLRCLDEQRGRARRVLLLRAATAALPVVAGVVIGVVYLVLERAP